MRGVQCVKMNSLIISMLVLHADSLEDSILKVAIVFKNLDVILTLKSFPDVVFGTALPATGPIFREKLNCGEDDDSLTECHSFSSGKPSTCDHTQDIAIQCRGMNIHDTVWMLPGVYEPPFRWLILHS